MCPKDSLFNSFICISTPQCDYNRNYLGHLGHQYQNPHFGSLNGHLIILVDVSLGHQTLIDVLPVISATCTDPARIGECAFYLLADKLLCSNFCLE